MIVLEVVGWVVFSLYVAQTYYLAIMSLARAKAVGQIVPGTWQSIWFALWLVPGVIIDWFLNMTLFSIFFLELPKTEKRSNGTIRWKWYAELITGRLIRHCGKPTWRGKLASWICHNFLDKFDPRGKHC
jgi:hypothetical protein